MKSTSLFFPLSQYGYQDEEGQEGRSEEEDHEEGREEEDGDEGEVDEVEEQALIAPSSKKKSGAARRRFFVRVLHKILSRFSFVALEKCESGDHAQTWSASQVVR